MQSPLKTCVFKSDLAPLLSAFIAEKQRMGFKYHAIEVYLKSFDTYLLDKNCKEHENHSSCHQSLSCYHYHQCSHICQLLHGIGRIQR